MLLWSIVSEDAFSPNSLTDDGSKSDRNIEEIKVEVIKEDLERVEMDEEGEGKDG